MSDKYSTFKALHESGETFVIPNPWDVGTARILANMGFKALATTSAGMAFSLGVREGVATREQVLSHCNMIVEATTLPVSADLEKGFGDSPESAADTIRAAAELGLAGCSLEDHTGDPQKPIFDFDLTVDRVAAAVEACRDLPHPFVFTARAEGRLWGQDDLNGIITRLQAFEQAGADVLYAPGLYDLDSIRAVCSSVSKPVNVVMGMPGTTFGVSELREAGVTRISTGSALARAAFGEFVCSAKEIATDQHFSFSDRAIGFSELEDFIDPRD